MAGQTTRVNYFVVNGTKYYTGRVFKINFCGKIQEAVFRCYIPITNRVNVKLPDSGWFINADEFRSMIVEITDKIDPSVQMPIVHKKNELEIDGLFIGWIWYIVLMVASALFYDRIGLWIFISVVFFNWRKKKIKEEGTWIEW